MSWPTAPLRAGRTYLIETQPHLLFAFAGSPTAVSTETPLLALTQYGDAYKHLSVTLRNHDNTNKAELYVDRSETGTVKEAKRQLYIVPPASEWTEHFNDIRSLFWGISASGDPDASYPSVNVTWQLVAVLR